MKIYVSSKIQRDSFTCLEEAGLDVEEFHPSDDIHEGSWIISEKVNEIKAGIESGCRTICLNNSCESVTPTLFAPSPQAAAEFILANIEI